MNKEDWKKAEKYNYNLLDKIDLQPYIHKWDSIYDIMNAIEDDVSAFEEPIREAINDPIMQGEIFNHIGDMEFMNYLHNRYGTRFEQEIRYYVIREKDDTNK